MLDDIPSSPGLREELRITRARIVYALVTAAVAIWAAVTITCCLPGCATVDPMLAAYTAESVACIDQATTRYESVACRDRVRAKYRLLARDGGIE